MSKKQCSDEIFVEICQKPQSIAAHDTITENIKFLILSKPDTKEAFNITKNNFLKEHIEEFSVWDTKGELLLPGNPQFIQIDVSMIKFIIYRLHDDVDDVNMLDCDEENVQVAEHCQLPNRLFNNLWSSLVYDTDVKENLLNYASTMLYFSDYKINQALVSWNRVVLLHGPPGTGKTSLCKALAHKLSIRLSHRYRFASLLEINSHSLFSKWFSESGKLVQKMFLKVEELIEDENHLVCLIIDEIESLTAIRSNVNTGTEPSDAIRVVNAVLTNLDRLKHHSNLLILTTSNITGKIDEAFINRADIKFFIGNPSPLAIYTILKSCVDELTRVGIIESSIQLQNASDLNLSVAGGDGPNSPSKQLWDIASCSVGLSGRTLRKLPFLTFAKFLHGISPSSVSLEVFLEALSRAVSVQFKEQENMKEI